MKNIMLKNLVVILLLLPILARSQAKLSGRVTDEKQAALGWANVMLLDSTGKIASGTTSKEDGSFELQYRTGSFTLRISAVGYIDFRNGLLLRGDSSLGNIALRADTKSLSEVSIIGRRKLVQFTPGGLVFDVQNSVAASGGNAVNALSSAPGVIVENNTVSMLGKGASRVMVDGRMVELSGEELMGFLKSIPSADIRNIEVIGNPPAKYQSAGNGGLININLKKGSGNSWKNSTTAAYDQNSYGTLSLSNVLLYNRERFRLSLSGNGQLGHSRVSQRLDTYYPSGLWNLDYTGKQDENKRSGRFALDYDLSKNTSVGVQYFGSRQTPGTSDHTDILIHNASGGLDSVLVNQGTRMLGSTSHTYNAHLVSTLDTMKRILSFDLDYFSFRSGFDNDFRATVFTPQMDFVRNDQSANNNSAQNIDNYSAKVDMEHPVKGMNLAYGAKISSIASSADVRYFNTISGSPVPDPSRSNSFSYRENNQAIYLSGTGNIGTKFGLNLGLRLENTQTTGRSADLARSTKTSYLKLFPTLDITFKASSSHNFSINYGRRINRPGFALLNPFRSYINSNSYSEGNPFLQPSFSDNFDLTHSYKGLIRTELFINRTANGFGPVFTSNSNDNTLVITRENYYKGLDYGLGVTLTNDITPWWQSQNLVYLLGSRTSFINGINANPSDKAQLYLSSNNTLSIGKSTKVQVDYRYHTAYTRGLYSFGNLSSLNLGLRQGMWKEKVSVSLLANDVFNRAYLRNYSSVVNGTRQVYNENNSSRYFRLSFAYSFGNKDIKVKQREFGNDEERRRTN